MNQQTLDSKPEATPAGEAYPAARDAVAAHAVSDTLRIPLVARAFGDTLFPGLALHDRYARDTLARLGDDGQSWLRQRSSIYGCLARACTFRDLALAHLQQHPAGQVANLGCGLSHYFQWLDNGQAHMIDADLPDVMALRRELLGPPGERHVLADLDLCQAGWWDRLGLPATRDGVPVYLMSEGVLMYLPPAAVNAVLAEFGERAPAGSTLAFDTMCWLTMGRGKQHPVIRHTKAEIAWGPRRPADLLAPHPRLRLTKIHNVMRGYGLVYSVLFPLFQRLAGVPPYGLYELRAADA